VAPTEITTVLSALRAELARVLGDQLTGLVLFGSRARGDADPASDIDVLVVVRGDFDYGDMIRRTSAVVAGLSLEHDVVISRAFISQERFDHERSPFLLNMRREGVAL
jgi:predicted nucleotidyltransferase